MGMDKKVVDGSLRFVLASRLGSVEVRDDVELPVLAATLSAFGP
jgi:3-dehydroquinate synthetase